VCVCVCLCFCTCVCGLSVSRCTTAAGYPWDLPSPAYGAQLHTHTHTHPMRLNFHHVCVCVCVTHTVSPSFGIAEQNKTTKFPCSPNELSINSWLTIWCAPPPSPPLPLSLSTLCINLPSSSWEADVDMRQEMMQSLLQVSRGGGGVTISFLLDQARLPLPLSSIHQNKCFSRQRIIWITFKLQRWSEWG